MLKLMGVAYFLLLRASELWAYDNSKKIHSTFGLTRKNINFYKGTERLDDQDREEADRVEVRFVASKGDQMRVGCVLGRTKVEGRVGAVELLLDILREQDRWGGVIPSDLPLAAYKKSMGGKWQVWTRKQAVGELRRLMTSQGREGKEYALHSFRIGGATTMASLKLDAYLIKREGRWKSDAFMAYIRAVLSDAELVSAALSDTTVLVQLGEQVYWC
jgi:hypothetical protein